MDGLVRLLRVWTFQVKRFLRGPGFSGRPRIQPLASDAFAKAGRVARETGLPIPSVLVQLNMVGEREVQMARAQEMGWGYIDIERLVLDPKLRSILPLDFLAKHGILPIKDEAPNLFLAIPRPCPSVLDEIALATRRRVIPVLAVSDEIDKKLAEWTELEAPPSTDQ